MFSFNWKSKIYRKNAWEIETKERKIERESVREKISALTPAMEDAGFKNVDDFLKKVFDLG